MNNVCELMHAYVLERAVYSIRWFGARVRHEATVSARPFRCFKSTSMHGQQSLSLSLS